MNSKASPAGCQSDSEASTISEDQVVNYLRQNPGFFARQDDLLAEISLPHDSGNAISLLERQVNILRARGTEARQKLNNLLENARNNDQLFDTTQNLVLALLRSSRRDRNRRNCPGSAVESRQCGCLRTYRGGTGRTRRCSDSANTKLRAPQSRVRRRIQTQKNTLWQPGSESGRSSIPE